MHAAERAEIALRVEEFLGQGNTNRADKLLLQILDAHMKAQTLQVGTRSGRANIGHGKASTDDSLLRGITQSSQSDACPLRPELHQVTGDPTGPADRKDRDAFRIEVTATADRQRLKRDLVADAFDEDDGMGTFRLRQRQGSRLGRGGGPAHITSK